MVPNVTVDGGSVHVRAFLGLGCDLVALAAQGRNLLCQFGQHDPRSTSARYLHRLLTEGIQRRMNGGEESFSEPAAMVVYADGTTAAALHWRTSRGMPCRPSAM